MMRSYAFDHMDAFADVPFAGNGVAVVHADAHLIEDVARMLKITREFKQFETIFLSGWDQDEGRARIFTMEGELAFAGHPVLGAAAALHSMHYPQGGEAVLHFHLAEKVVLVRVARTDTGWRCAMRQGPPAFLREVAEEAIPYFAAAHNLREEALYPGLPMAVVTTGLPYLLIPTRTDLEDARITVRDLAPRLAALGAAYSYLFNPDTLVARTWDNLGLIEDTATGSAAGPTCAYLVRHGRLSEGERITIRQGDWAGHPGRLTAWMEDGEVYVQGHVIRFAAGRFDA